MNETQKKAAITVVVVVLAIALLYGLRWFVEKFPPSQQDIQQTVTETTQPETTQAEDQQTAGQQAAKKNATGLAYEQALAQYKDRFQFKDCRGVKEPTGAGGSMVLKLGQKLMLDNRDPVPHTIAFKGVSVKIDAYDFAIVTANTLGTYNVTCDGGGAATLNVQK